ncbi:hypothetical protein SH467x_003512 [Pirellulaceae bacterium SH467]
MRRQLLTTSPDAEGQSASTLLGNGPPDEIVRDSQNKAAQPQGFGTAMPNCDGFASVDAMNRLNCVEDRPVYGEKDTEFVNSVLHEAVMTWSFTPKKARHRCELCWDVAPAIALRAEAKDSSVTTVIIHKTNGCGDLQLVLHDIEEKIAFLRSRGLGAFLIWVNNCHSAFGRVCDLN